MGTIAFRLDSTFAEGASVSVSNQDAGRLWFDQLDEAQLRRAFRLACILLRDAHEAEDATQEALARAWSGRRSLRNLDSASGWFDRILVNVCRDQLRRRRGAVRWLSMSHDMAASGSDPLARMVAADPVLRAIASLDPEHQVVVLLRYWEDLPLSAIAERLRIPVGTVKSRLHFAIRDLRSAIGDRSMEDSDRG
jgi:RNA polymerase sigma factor (sigma-70 family)